MFQYVHQLVAYCVRLLFCAEQVVYSGSVELFQKLLWPENDDITAARVNQNSKVADRTVKR